MTPKQEVRELVDGFRPFVHRIDINEKLGSLGIFSAEERELENAKQCALICVDRIIKSFTDATWILDTENTKYWQEVKQELLK